MAYGRQRRVAAILKKKREEEAARQGLNALSADNITKIVSDDANDLDQVQFTTTNGAKVNIQNQRGKTEEGQTVTPTIKTLGQSFSGGSLQNILPQLDSLGQSFSGGSLQNNLPEPELELPQAVADFTGQPVGKSFSGGSLQNNLPQIDRLGNTYTGGATQANYGQVVNEAPVQTYTVTEGSQEDLDLQQNPEVIGETLNDDGTVTYQLQDTSNTTQQVATPAPGLYDNVQPGQEVALTPEDAYIDTAPNLSSPTDVEVAQLDAEFAAREADNQLRSNMTQESIAFDESRGVDPLLSLAPEKFSERSDKLDPMVIPIKEEIKKDVLKEKAIAEGAVNADGSIDQIG